MSELTVANYLAALQDDPWSNEAFEGLATALASDDPKRRGEDPVRLLEFARRGHEVRGESHAAARLIHLELGLTETDADFRLALLKELGRLRREDLMDDEGARQAFEQAIALKPDDEDVRRALDQLKAVSEKWQDLAKHFIDQADQASDAALKTSLLVRAASILWQYKKKGKNKEIDRLFKEALETDPASARAARLYEITLRERERWKDLGAVLLGAAQNAAGRDDQLGLFLAAGRVLSVQLKEREQAASCFERVLELLPAHEEALGFLVGYFTEREQWDHLVALYEDALRARQLKADAEQGILLQIAMVHWRMLKRPERAEPYFARVRKADPAQPVMLDFYRELYGASGETQKLLGALSDAQRRAQNDEDKLKLSLEIARLAQNDPQGFERAIDAWKVVLRYEPSNAEALSSLKQLYRRSGKWNALVELLRTEVDALPAEARDDKLAILRDLVEIYRDELKLEAMVLTTYNAILQIDPASREALTELARTYEEMGRYNDLIPVLLKEAEQSEEPKQQVALYTRIAKLWIDHFSNYNQATGPLEKVLALEPDNRAALAQLKEIYSKKRAWKQLFGVLAKEEELATSDDEKRPLVLELATLAGERLHEYPEAIALYKRLLDLDAGSVRALDAIEKLAERAKDWQALVFALEQRVERGGDVPAKVKLLSRIGSLHAERTQNPELAAEAWKRVLALEPKNARAMRTLREAYLAAGDFDAVERLYAEASDLDGFVDVLATVADRTSDPELKKRLSFRAAELYEQKLNEPARAMRSYERVLAVDGGNERAARALLPLYEKEEKWPRVALLLDVLLVKTGEEQSEEWLNLATRLLEVLLTRLRDGERAFALAARAYKLAPEDARVLKSLEAAADLAHAHDRLAKLLAERADVVTGDTAIALRRRVAQLLSEKLKKPEEAARQLERILADRPEDADASLILERIYRAIHRPRELVALLARRLELTTATEARVHLLTELARIEENELNAPEQAIARYQAIFELQPDHDVTLATLERLLSAGNLHADQADVLEKRIALAPSSAQKLELTIRLGQISARHLNDVDRALSAFTAALGFEPTEPRAIAALEEIEQKHAHQSLRIGHILEPVYERTMALDKLSNVLGRRLAVSKDEVEKRALKLRIAEIAGMRGDPKAAYNTLESAFLDNPSSPELWDQLARMAAQASMQQELSVAFSTAIEAAELSAEEIAELSMRTARIYDEVLGQPEKAEPFHLRVLAHDPLAEDAYHALRELYTNNERWDDLKALYRNRISQTNDVEHKLELLLQVCFLFEEILDDVDMAIRAYREVIELEPDHATSLRALERLYTRAERFRDLVELLEGDRNRTEGKEAIELTYRIGELYEHKLREPALAVDQYASVLEDQPTHLRAQEALERLIVEPSQRQRIAGLLEPLYTEQGARPELARVLNVQLESLNDPGARVSVLMRLGELFEDHLQKQGEAFAAYVRAVEADPADPAPRGELARLARTMGRLPERAKVLEAALEEAEDNGIRSEILGELAELWDVLVGDSDRAIAAYTRLIEHAPDDPEVVLPAARALERLYLMRDDAPALVDALRKQVPFEPDLDIKKQLLARLSQLYEEKLSDVPAAIGAWVERLDLDNTDLPALAGLERLYEQRGEWQKLIGVLQKRDGLAEDEEEARVMARRVGDIYEHKLNDNGSAIAAYNEVLTRFGNDRDTIGALQRVYARTERHQDLLEALEVELELVQNPAERADVRFRAAELMRRQTGALEAALESYRSVLEDKPGHEPTITALNEMVASGGHMRVDAARALVAHYDALNEHDRLIRALEVVAESEEAGERLNALRRAAEIAEKGLSETGRAFALMGRAVRAALGEHDLGDLLDQLDRLARASGRSSPYVELLREILPDVQDEELAFVIVMRVAKITRDELGDRAMAREYFEKALSLRPEDHAALDALEALHADNGDHRALLDILRKKTDLASEPIERSKLLIRQAELCADKLDDVSAAIEAYEKVLEEELSLSVFQGVERLYERAGRWVDLGAMYERQLDAEIGDSVTTRYRLAKVSQDHLNDPERALELFGDVLERQIMHEPTRVALEAMLDDELLRPRAAELLEPIYLRTSSWAQLSRALEAQLESENDPGRKKDLLLRLAQLHEVQLEDLDAALETYARLFRVDPADDDTQEALTRLSRAVDKKVRVAEVYEQYLDDVGVTDETAVRLSVSAAHIRDHVQGNLERSAYLYQRALAFDPAQRSLADALEDVLVRQRAHEELRVFYRAQADVAPDERRRVACLHKLAKVLDRDLNDRDRAVDAYREILEVRPTDEIAIAALDRLLADALRFSDLAEHLRHQIDQAVGTALEVELKTRLATLHEEHLADVSSAIDVYEDVVRIDAGNPQARVALERLAERPELLRRVAEILMPLYEAAGEWEKQIWLNERLIGIEPDPTDRARLLSDIAQLCEERGKNLPRALAAWRRALVTDPRDDQARLEVERIAAALGDWDSLVGAYEAAVLAANETDIKAQLLAQVARTHDERRGDPRAAILAYERLVQIESDDPTPFEQLEALLTMVGDWPGLVRLLERKIERTSDSIEKGELWRRMGSVLDELMGETDRAIEAYRSALSENEDDPISLEALDGLYVRNGDAPSLAEVLRRRIEMGDSDVERAELGLRLGQLLNEKLDRRAEAIDAFRRVLEDDAQNLLAIDTLARLHEAESQWSYLLEVLRQRLELTTETHERIALTHRIAKVLEDKLSETEEAIETYRAVLELDANHEPAIAALLSLGENAEWRALTEQTLEPVLRAQGRFEDLAVVLARSAAAALDPVDRQVQYVRLAEVHEQGRKDLSAAFAALSNALLQDADDEALYDQVERVASLTQRFAEAADVFEQRGSATSDAHLARELLRRAAVLAERELKDLPRATRDIEQALEKGGEDDVLLIELDRLYTATARFEDLADVLERRVAASADGTEAASLLMRLGELREQQFADKMGALSAYKEVLEREPLDKGAVAALERLLSDTDLAPDVIEILDGVYREAGDMRRVADLYDVRVKLADSSAAKVSLLSDLASLWEQDLGDFEKAGAALRAAFELDTSDFGRLDEIERIAAASGSFEILRGLVEPAANSTDVARGDRRDLWMRAAAFYRDRLNDPAAAERSLREALQLEPEHEPAHEALVDLLRNENKQADLVQALIAWAERDPDLLAQTERLRDAAKLAEQAGNEDEAVRCYDRILQADATAVDALDELIRIHESHGRQGKVVKLLDRRIELEESIDDRVKLRHRAAALREALGDHEAAIQLHLANIEDDEGDVTSLSVLERLYEAAERWDDLLDILNKRIEEAETPEERVSVRVRLALVSEQRLGNTDRAIDELNEILAEMPDHAEASDALERLLTTKERFSDLAEHLERRADRARDLGDARSELALQVRLGRVFDEHVGDSHRAAECYERVLERDPEHVEALRALARLCVSNGDEDRAVEILERLLARTSGEELVTTAFQIADLCQSDPTDQARVEAALRSALATGVRTQEVSHRLATMFERNADYASLAELWSEEADVLMEVPTKVALLMRVADLYKDKLHDVRKAAESLERASQLVPEDRAVLVPLCELYIAAGRQQDAVPVLQKIIASFAGRRVKEVAAFHRTLSRAYAGMGDTERALLELDAAYRVDLTNVSVLTDLGLLCYERGDFDRAQKTFRGLLLQKLDKDAPITKADVYFYLGDISFKQGDKAKAISMLERAVAEQSSHMQAKALLTSLKG
jgi:tetratricopeptide (TPR) repeat protein